MAWRGMAGTLGGGLRRTAWWTTIAPLSIATELRYLGVSPTKPLQLIGAGESDQTTELLGRLLAFQRRVRYARSIIILFRAVLLCLGLILVSRALDFFFQWQLSAWLPLMDFLLFGWAIHLAMNHTISPFEAARLVDSRLGLQAQLATAVEATTTRRLNEPLALAQVRAATRLARTLDPQRAIPLIWPGKDARSLVALVVLYAGLVLLQSFGVTIPRPQQAIDAEVAAQARKDAQAPSPYVSVDAAQIQSQTISPAAATTGVSQQLNTLQQQLNSQAITPAQYQQSLQHLQQQIQTQAKQSLAAQDALNALANALKDSSSTQPISDSLNQGNYKQAASQINSLANQVGNLSPQARAELAKQLSQAAQQTAPLNQGMSSSASQASQALNQGNASQAKQSLQQLAQAVNGASQQVANQAQLGQAMQQVQQQMGGQQAKVSGSNSQAAAKAPATAGASGQQANGQPSQSGAQANSPGSGNAQTGASSQTSMRSSSGAVQNSQGNPNGGAGNGPGSNAPGQNGPPLDVSGKKLTIIGQPSGQTSSGPTTAGNRSVPLTSPNSSTISGGGGASGPASNVPINVHQENSDVPLNLKPVVRDYFSHAGP